MADRLARQRGEAEASERSFWPNFFARNAGRLEWDATAIDLGADARAWPELPEERRQRLTALLCGFRVAEDAVAEHLTPFGAAAQKTSMASDETLVAWCFSLQRRDEVRHSRIFDRIAAEVLGLPGDTPEDRQASARDNVAPAVLELFEERLPAMSAELHDGRIGLSEGLILYHMILEGVVFAAGQRAVLDDLADGVLPGVREGVQRVELDERWHIGFGLRCLKESQPSQELLTDLLGRAENAAAAWGEAVPQETRERSARMCARRLGAAGLIERRAAA